MTDSSIHSYEKLGAYQEPRMRRDVNWLQVVFIAAGSPALVMFNLGGLAAITGTISPLIWAISVILGFLELFVYAEIAGLHPHKSGGTAVHGATAWVRYSKIVAPISIFSNWLAWSPDSRHRLRDCIRLPAVDLFSAGPSHQHVENYSARPWSHTAGFDRSHQLQFILGTIIMVAVWSVQHTGILRTARAATLLTIGGLLPLVLVTIVPFFTGAIDLKNFSPFVPLNGSWNLEGWRLVIGGLFLAAWSTTLPRPPSVYERISRARH